MTTARTALALLTVLGTAALAGCQTTEEDVYWGSETTVYRSGYPAPRSRTVWVDDDPVIYGAPRYRDGYYRPAPPPRYARPAPPPPRYDRPAPPPPRYDRPAPPPPQPHQSRPTPGVVTPGMGPIGNPGTQPGGRRGPNGEWIPN
jgi:hypothetical protein